MKVSVNWLKDYVDIDIDIDELVDKIGKQLGAVEEVIDVGAKYQGIIIAKVVSCEKHPDADRLNVCMIDDGGNAQGVERDDNGLVQVVCGAPNVKAGLLVAWLPPGSTVPSTYDNEPFVLGARELRGVISNGMIASGKELSINDDHSGILELQAKDESIVGADFAETYGLNDYVIDIENKMFTHRPDAFGIMGVAREIAGILGKEGSPGIFWGERTTGDHDADKELLVIKNELPELVPRFMAQIFQNITIQPSSLDIQLRLMKVGIRPINNIVDITNYMMYDTGQPMHAYDYDKVKARSVEQATIVIRHPKAGEKLRLLNGKEIEPRSDAVMIATDKEVIGLGGVMGGADTEVDDNTTNIILECANFDMYNVRRTSMEHGIFTDAVTRFNKGQSPLQCEYVMGAATDMFIHEVPGATPSRSIYDVHGYLPQPPTVEVSAGFINDRLGLELTDFDITTILQNVCFTVESQGATLNVTAPLWRTDIALPEDIVEEVGRLHGYDKLPMELPSLPATPTKQDAELTFKATVRQSLSRLGANEVLTYSFVHGNLLEKAGQNKDLAFKIGNALSPDLQYYRLSLTPSLLAHIHPNIKTGYDRFALFEIGKAHNKLHKDDDNGVPKEYDMISLVYADTTKDSGPAYYAARAYLDELAVSLGITVEYRPIDKESDYPVTRPFEPSRSALAFAAGSNVALGIIGEYKASVRQQLKLPAKSAGFEIGLQELLKTATGKKYRPLSRFPSVTQDICLQVPEATTYGELTKQFTDALYENLKDDQLVDYEPIDIYSSEKLEGKKRITYRVKLTSYERTLTDEVLTKLLDTAAQATGAEQI